jgi:4'-phosphopantetheinyl transferase
MRRTIQIEFSKISQFYQFDSDLERTVEIAQRKQAIYTFRNYLLSHHLKNNIDQNQIETTAHGKPFLKDYPSLAFNHSHSQNYYVLGLSERVADLGVDIEELSRPIRFEALAKHAFHPHEYQTWQSLDYDPNYWFKVWTIKEAVLKAHGMGIRMSLKELETQAHPTHMGGMCEHPNLGVFAYQNYEIQGCMLTIAWRSQHSCEGFAYPTIKINTH